MKPTEWIKKLKDKYISKESFLAISEEEAKELDNRFIDREEVNAIIDKKLTHYESNLKDELNNKNWQAMNKDRVELLTELKNKIKGEKKK